VKKIVQAAERGVMYAAFILELPMRTVILLSALSACTSMDGTYTGECVMVMSNVNVPYEVEVDIVQMVNGTLDGGGQMVNASNVIYRGDIDGEWDGDEVSFSLEFEKTTDQLEQWGAMTFKGLYDGSEIDGDCTLDDYKEGTFDLER